MIKPPQLNDHNAARFQQQSIVDRYHLRAPYPPETFDILESLLADEPRTMLDVGTGLGDIARPMVVRGLHVDAIDPSQPMLDRARTLPDGNHPNLRWILGLAETVEVNPPYALITGGDSLHWLKWEIAFPRFAQMITSNGVIAILTRHSAKTPWDEERMALIKNYSTMREYKPYSMSEELTKRGLFEQIGEQRTAPIAFQQTIDEFIGAEHSRSSLSLDDMPPDNAAAFDRELRVVLEKYADENGILTMQIEALITWGKPLST
ncbi:MAG: class I SAM-dependent methyltransferase [Chloroflexi bacterium]|nr:class I SAM-dependent methyltransferase [Chloroflexota bacterium]